MASALDTLTNYFALPENAAGAQPYVPDQSYVPDGGNFLDPSSPLAPYQLPDNDPGINPGGKSTKVPLRTVGGKKDSALAALQDILANAPPVSGQPSRIPPPMPLASMPIPSPQGGLVGDNGQPLPSVPNNPAPGTIPS